MKLVTNNMHHVRGIVEQFVDVRGQS